MNRAEEIVASPSSLPGCVRAHHFNWGEQGDQDQGVWRPIRCGGNSSYQKGVDVVGHEHVEPNFVAKIRVGATLHTSLPTGERVSVKLDLVEGLGPFGSDGMITQDEDEIGFRFCGTIVDIS